MKKLSPLQSVVILSGLFIIMPVFIYFSVLNFGDQRIHIEKKQWNPADAADQGIDPKLIKKATDYIENRLPMARGMVIIKNGKTVHEKYYWKGGPQEKDYLHSMGSTILHALIGIAMESQLLSGPSQDLADLFPAHTEEAQSLTIADLLRVQAPLIWGEEATEYWKLFYSRDRIKSSLQALKPHDGRPESVVNPAAKFAANYLLAEIIRTTSSMSVFEFADQHLFAPMGITTLADIKKNNGLMDQFTGFKLRTLDLAKYGHLVMNQGEWEGKQIIPAAWAMSITRELRSGSDNKSLGGWQPVVIAGTETIMATGEGGQHIVLWPELDLLVAVSSKSVFPLSDNSGYNHLFQLIFEAAGEKLEGRQVQVALEDRPYYEPVFVYATEVPGDIRQFFKDLAKDIATNDVNRILYHYAKGYKASDKGKLNAMTFTTYSYDDYGSRYAFWRKIFDGGPGDLEFVYIEKIRIDGNRAYLRGTLKYSYYNMNEGSIGWFPLENLIKLRGRWLWLGSPDSGAILDRDEYFDAEISVDLSEFIKECGPALTGASDKDKTACFTDDFLYNGQKLPHMQEMLRPLWDGDGNIEIHINKVTESEREVLLEGSIDGSLIGTVSLPLGIKAVRQGNGWKWSGNGVK